MNRANVADPTRGVNFRKHLDASRECVMERVGIHNVLRLGDFPLESARADGLDEIGILFA